MQQYNFPGDGKTEARAAGLAGARLVHTVKALKDQFLLILRDADAVVLNANVAELVVRIQRDLHIAVLLLAVVLNAVFD